MSESTYFLQECPTCGRSLHIRVEYLGRKVCCPHCRGRLTAFDTEGTGPAPTAEALAMMRRVDELLEGSDPNLATANGAASNGHASNGHATNGAHATRADHPGVRPR